MSGLQEYDFLYQQAQAMLEYFTSVTNNLNSVSSGLSALNFTQLIAYIGDGDTENALTLAAEIRESINSIKGTNSATKEVITASETLVNSLVPMINEAVVNTVGTMTTTRYFMCFGCSAKCSFPSKFAPHNYPKCYLDGSAVEWKEVNAGGEVITQ